MTGWHLERQQPDGRFIRLTETRVDPGLFDPPDSVYRIHDATARVPAGNRITCRLVIVDLELQEWPTADAACEVEHATAEFGASPAPDQPMHSRKRQARLPFEPLKATGCALC